jgi:hypothetical protein
LIEFVCRGFGVAPDRHGWNAAMNRGSRILGPTRLFGAGPVVEIVDYY